MSNFYRAARARVKKGYLLGRELIEGLIEQKTIEDAIEILKSTEYRKELLELKAPYKLTDVEHALLRNLLRHFYELITSSIYSAILLAYFNKFIIHNLKLVLKGKALNKKYEELYDTLILDAEAYLGRRDIIIKVLEAANLEEAVLQLSRLPFGKEVTLAFNAYKDSKNLNSFDIILDKVWINQLIEAWLKSDNKDRKDTRDLVGLEVDKYNIMSLLRAKNLSLDSSLQREILARKTFFIEQDVISNMLITESIESCIQMLKGTHYRFLISEEIKGKEDLDKLERNFMKTIFKTAQSKFVRNPITIGEAFAFVILKEAEIKNITSILFGIENGVSPSLIREMLFL